MRMYSKGAAAEYRGFEDKDSKNYFWNLHKEGRGPDYVKPSDRRIFFTEDSLDRWMQTWQVVER